MNPVAAPLTLERLAGNNNRLRALACAGVRSLATFVSARRRYAHRLYPGRRSAYIGNGSPPQWLPRDSMIDLSVFSVLNTMGAALRDGLDRGTITRHQGQILVRTDDGKSATFRVELPIIQPVPESAATKRKP